MNHNPVFQSHKGPVKGLIASGLIGAGTHYSFIHDPSKRL